MHKGLKGLILIAVVLAGSAAGVVGSQAAVVDYVGYGWETGGLDPSQPGDIFAVAALVTDLDPLFEVDLGANEVTLFIDGLVSQGGVTNNAGTTTTVYTGGTLAVYADPSFNHDWGVNPPNPTVPGSFTDGELIFAGQFTSFTLVMQSTGSGVFQGTLDATGGSALAGPCTGCSYTIAGAFSSLTGANIPSGYDVQVDGILEVEATVANETRSWGSVKTLFRTGN